jgi:hypothetical protein
MDEGYEKEKFFSFSCDDHRVKKKKINRNAESIDFNGYYYTN